MSYEKRAGFIGVKKDKSREAINKMVGFLTEQKLLIKWDNETYGVVVNDIAKALAFLKDPKLAEKYGVHNGRIIRPWDING